MSEALVEHHVLEYPGGYTRSVGPALSRYLSGLRDGVIVGVRGADGRVLVPPTEYDPVTAADLDDYVEVGPAGTVVAWTWVAEPRPGKHHLDRSFAFALVRPDGADTAMVHVVDARRPDELAIGARVAPRWAAERHGYVTDLEAWVPLPEGQAASPAPPNAAADASDEAITGIVTPIRLEYDINAGIAASKYLRALGERRIVGQRAVDSDQVYVPPRGSDPTSGAPTEVEVEVGQKGTVTTYCVVNIPGLSENAPEIPYVCAQILLDGSNTPWFGLVHGVAPDDVRMGMRVGAVWVDDPGPNAGSIKWFEPTGAPDAPYEEYKDYA
ncbi:MAG: DNA-binding protein [Actinobacteria bacterium]|nr:DNA-binding protein [Actinomycetota bacterium]